MTSLDVGALVGRVVLETATFDRVYARVVRQFSQLGAEAGKGAAGVATADEAFVGLARSSSTAVAGVTRSTTAARTAGAAHEKAAAATRQHAMAVTRVADTMASLTGVTDRERAATLRALAAQERYDEVLASGAASTRSLASAQAGLITSQRSVAAAQDAVGASATRTGRSMHGLLHTVRDLGLIFGGLELAKQAIEFVGAGKELTTALNGVQAASHATDAQMAAVRRQAVALGKDMTVPAATAVDAADAIQDLVRAGMALPRAMAAARPALLLASAAQVSTADSARILGDTLDDFALPASEAVHVANSLAGAATSAGGGLIDMFEALKFVGPSARIVGVGVDDVTASIAELAKSGIQGSLAGTGMRMMFQALAKSSPAAQKALHDLGVEAWDSRGRFVGLRSLYEQLHGAQERFGPDSRRFLKDINTAFGARAATTVAVFAHRGVEGFNQFSDRVKSGDVQHYADLMNRGVAASMKAIRKELTAAGIDVYTKVEPAFAAAAMWLGQELPKAGHAAASVLGGPLHLAWSALTAVVGLAGDVIEPVIRLLDSPVGSAVATGVLAMWAAWKGFAIVTSAYQAVRAALIGIQVTAANGLNSFQAYGRGVVGVLEGNSTVAAATSGEMQAAMLTEAQAEIDAQLVRERAAAATAAAYADMVLASEDASAAMISSSQNAALAAQLQADATAAAAAEIATASEAAAAEVEAAGEAASVGWAGILGPIGLVAVGVVTAASAFGLLGDSAKSNAAEVESLTTAIQRDSDALGANTRQVVSHALASSGALDAAEKLGLSLPQVTDAALHGGPALAALNQALGLMMAGSFGSAKGSEAQTRAARLLYAALNDQNTSVGQAVRVARQEAIANAGSTHATQADTSAKHANAAATTSNAAAIRKLISAEMAEINASLARAQSQDQFLESIRATTTQLKGNSGTLSKNTADGLANRDALLSSVQAALSLKDAQDKAGGSVKAHTRTLADNIANLRAAAIAAGADKGEVDKLLTSLHATPKEIRTTMDVETEAARRNARALVDWLNSLTAIVHVTTDAAFGGTVLRTGTTGTGIARAAGGPIVGPGTATSDSVPIMGSNGEHMISAAEVQGLGGHGAVEAIRAAGRAGQRVMGFANGGAIGRISSALRSAFGLSNAQIAGILGNLQVESHLNPRAYNARENAHGLAQWEGSRWTALQSYARGMGLSATSTQAQVGFLVRELRGSGLIPQIRRMSDPRHVAAFVDAHYERSSGSTRRAREDAAASFAAGGTGGGGGIRHVGKNWIYNGSRYASERAAQNAQTRAEKKTNDGTRIGTMLGNIGHTSSPPFQVSEAGWTRIARQLRNAKIALDGAHLSNAARRTLQAQLSRLTHLAFAQEHQLKVKIRTSDLRAVRAAIHGTVAESRAAFAQLIGDLRKSGATARQLVGIRWEQQQFIKEQHRYIAEQARAAKVSDYSSGIRSTLAGTFDPTKSGSITDLLAGFQGQTDQNNAYKGEVDKLRAEAKGNPKLLAFINQLEQSGQTTTLQTLAGASKGELAQVSKAYGGYQVSLGAGADAATLSKYGVTSSQEQAKVDKLHKGLEQIAGAIGTMAGSLSHERATITLANGTTLDAHITRHIDAHLGRLTTAVKYGHKRHR